MQMWSIALQNAMLEQASKETLLSDGTNDKVHWSEILSRLLSGMSDNLSKTVYSSTLGHFIATMDLDSSTHMVSQTCS